MAGHTPGPWVVMETGFCNPPSYAVCEDAPGRVRPICAAEYEHPSAEANAHLIASAPDMLAALELARAKIAMIQTMSRRELEALRDHNAASWAGQLSDAINKARGAA